MKYHACDSEGVRDGGRPGDSDITPDQQIRPVVHNPQGLLLLTLNFNSSYPYKEGSPT